MTQTVFAEYRGMSYRQASEEGTRLTRQAALSGRWMDYLDRLMALREIMKRCGQ
jgi:hypothetical protein